MALATVTNSLDAEAWQLEKEAFPAIGAAWGGGAGGGRLGGIYMCVCTALGVVLGCVEELQRHYYLPLACHSYLFCLPWRCAAQTPGS